MTDVLDTLADAAALALFTGFVLLCAGILTGAL